MSEAAAAEQTIHATTVAFGNRALAILGPSGAGKSGLALQLMALGAELVADDRTVLARCGSGLCAAAPAAPAALAALAGRIEARGLGILAAPAHEGPVPLGAAVDLAQSESERLPPFRSVTFLGVSVDLVLARPEPYFPAALRHYMLHGRVA
ncbi:MAG: serine kinase [Alphaproteobacteria bacterium HGW-Alphaproteobacteria-2]|nr:MAG: serine kinase [Alphaproteobacteria bacterium HGW-Alphaproteobacteria-2]